MSSAPGTPMARRPLWASVRPPLPMARHWGVRGWWDQREEAARPAAATRSREPSARASDMAKVPCGPRPLYSEPSLGICEPYIRAAGAHRSS
jgi:hypothetical protein